MQTIHDTKSALEKQGADYLFKKISDLKKIKKQIIFGIVGGRSIAGILKNLSDLLPQENNLHIFMVDERWIAIDNKESNFYVVKESLKYGIFHPFDYKHDIAQYQKEFDNYGGTFDLVLLSAGEDGHVGSLFPNHDSIKSTDKKFIKITNSPKPPLERIAATKIMIQKAKGGLLVFFGPEKKGAYKNFNDPEITIDACPAKLFKEITRGLVLVTKD